MSTFASNIPPAQLAEHLAASAADLSGKRWRCAVKLLSAVAPIGRWGLELARRAGIGPEHFAVEDDVGAIWAGLNAADETGAIIDRERTAAILRFCLRRVGRWDESDLRPFVSTMQHGPGPLAAMFTSMSRDDAEQAIPHLAADLIGLAGQWDAMVSLANAAEREAA